MSDTKVNIERKLGVLAISSFSTEMAEIKYQPITHNHGAFLKKARKRRGFQAAYQALVDGRLQIGRKQTFIRRVSVQKNWSGPIFSPLSRNSQVVSNVMRRGDSQSTSAVLATDTGSFA